MRARIGLAALTLLSATMSVDAQVVYPPAYPYGYSYGYPGGWWGGIGPGYAGSTPAESYARGLSEVLRARGDAYEAAARGAISYEQARASYMENKLRWHEITLQRRQMGEQQRQQEAAAARAARERREANYPPKPPELLSDAQYDRTTGTVYWPELLAKDAFAESRHQLEEMLKIKAHTGDTFEINRQIYDQTQQMLADLRTYIREVPPASYMEARKFLDQLGRESRLALG